MSLSTMILPFLIAAAPATAGLEHARCPKLAVAPGKVAFRRLNELPPAEAFNAVWRLSECRAPAVLARDKIGPVPKPHP